MKPITLNHQETIEFLYEFGCFKMSKEDFMTVTVFSKMINEILIKKENKFFPVHKDQTFIFSLKDTAYSTGTELKSNYMYRYSTIPHNDLYFKLVFDKNWIES